MKYQPIPRLGVAVYPDKNQTPEQTFLSFVKVLLMPLCAVAWKSLHRMVKAVL
jgi:hypothetical protein